MREQLLGYLLGALEPQECEQVEEHLASDRVLQQELELLRTSLEPLELDDELYVPPSGLAAETCALVAKQSQAATPASRLTSGEAASSTSNAWRFIDWAVAVGIFVAGTMLFFPALQCSRVNSQLARCQYNLHQLYLSQAEFSNRNQGYFPAIPLTGNLAAAGVYAPKLHDKQYFQDSRLVVCPSSALAQEGNFRIPTAEEVLAASGADLVELRRMMGGSYGYHIGHMENGHIHGTRNLQRASFAIMADAPSLQLPNYQSENHGGHGQNVTFEDGHVKFLTSCQIRDSRDNIYCNDEGKLAPGLNADDSVIGHSGLMPVAYYPDGHGY